MLYDITIHVILFCDIMLCYIVLQHITLLPRAQNPALDLCRPDFYNQKGTLAFVGTPHPKGGIAPYTVSEARLPDAVAPAKK